jgi:hypothetical protein
MLTYIVLEMFSYQNKHQKEQLFKCSKIIVNFKRQPVNNPINFKMSKNYSF